MNTSAIERLPHVEAALRYLEPMRNSALLNKELTVLTTASDSIHCGERRPSPASGCKALIS